VIACEVVRKLRLAKEAHRLTSNRFVELVGGDSRHPQLLEVVRLRDLAAKKIIEYQDELEKLIDDTMGLGHGELCNLLFRG
jgi:hypothetical protein